MIPFGGRDLNALIVVVCGLSLAFALILEYGYNVLPCILCMVQRAAVAALGAVASVALFFNFSGWHRKLSAVVTMCIACAGGFFAARQIWLQHLPPEELPGCLPSIGYMFEVLPVMDALSLMMQGSSECSDVLWQFLGLSIPGWTLVLFVALLLMSSLHLADRWLKD